MPDPLYSPWNISEGVMDQEKSSSSLIDLVFRRLESVAPLIARPDKDPLYTPCIHPISRLSCNPIHPKPSPLDWIVRAVVFVSSRTISPHRSALPFLFRIVLKLHRSVQLQPLPVTLWLDSISGVVCSCPVLQPFSSCQLGDYPASQRSLHSRVKPAGPSLNLSSRC